MRATGEREITSEMLGNLLMGQLKELDKVAYLRFASKPDRAKRHDLRRGHPGNPARRLRFPPLGGLLLSARTR